MMLVLDRLPAPDGPRGAARAAVPVDLRVVRVRQPGLLRPALGGARTAASPWAPWLCPTRGCCGSAGTDRARAGAALGIARTAAAGAVAGNGPHRREPAGAPRCRRAATRAGARAGLPPAPGARRGPPRRRRAWKPSWRRASVARPGDPGPRRRVDRRDGRRRPRGRRTTTRGCGWSTGQPCPAAGSASRTRARSSPPRPTGSVLVFVDADVVLEPHAVAADRRAAARGRARPRLPLPAPGRGDRGRAARAAAAAVVVADLPAACAWPRPRSRQSLVGGQRAAARRRRRGLRGRAGARRRAGRGAGGRRAGRVPSGGTGAHGAVVDGTDLATCRMYDGWHDAARRLREVAVGRVRLPGRRGGRLRRCSLVLYVVPPVAALLGRGSVRRPGSSGTLAGIDRARPRGAPGRRAGVAGLAGPPGVRGAPSSALTAESCDAAGAARSPGRAVAAVSRVVVVGAGHGAGWPCAARLAVEGARRHGARAGADLGRQARRGTRGTASPSTPGPSLLTLPAVYRDMFLEDRRGPGDVRRAGARSDPVCHYRFADGTELDVPDSDRRAVARAFDEALRGGRRGRLAALPGARRAHLAGDPRPVPRPRPLDGPLRPAAAVDPASVTCGPIAPWRSLDAMGRRYLRDPRLRQFLLALRDVHRLGPAQGTRRARGGPLRRADLRRLVRPRRAAAARRRLSTSAASSEGSTFRFDSDVATVVVDGGRAAGVRLADGEQRARRRRRVQRRRRRGLRPARDRPVADRRVAPRLRRATPSLAGFVAAAGPATAGPRPARTTRCCSPRTTTRSSTRSSAGRPVPVADPTVYVSAPDDPALRPGRRQRGLVRAGQRARHDPGAGARPGSTGPRRVWPEATPTACST